MAPAIPLVVFTHVLVLEHNGREGDAAKVLAGLMGKMPGDLMLQMTLVRLLRKSGDARTAFNFLNALPIQGEVEIEWVAETARLMIKEGRPKEALRVFDLVHRKDPKRWEVIFDASLVALALEDPSALERWVNRGQRVAPTSPLWDRLVAAGHGEAWHESLKGRAKALGVQNPGPKD